MLSVTIPNISPSQNTPVLPNMRRIVTRPSGASCSFRNSAKLSLATMPPPSFLLAEIAAWDDDLARVVAGDSLGQGEGRFAGIRRRLVAGAVAQRVEAPGPVFEILGDDVDDAFL